MSALKSRGKLVESKKGVHLLAIVRKLSEKRKANSNKETPESTTEITADKEE